MITGLIQPKKWKKFIAIGGAALVAIVGTTCVVVRALPELSQELDATALIAAGLTLPNGAAEVLFHPEDASSSEAPASQAASEAPASSAASSEPDDSAEAVSSETVSSETDSSEPEKSEQKWTGKAYPIQELTLQNGGVQYDNVFVKNENDYTAIDIAEELEKQPDLTIKRDGTPQVLLYHTHTMESYLEEDSDTYYSDMTTRSTDSDRSVVAVGEEIAKQLEAAGIGVIHDKTVHDESYNGSYDRSAETIRKNLEEYPTIQVTIDIHRDSMTAEDGTRYKPTVEIDGKKAAQIMIISGCNDDGTLNFPDWEYNLRLAVRLQKASADLNPNFPRPLLFGPHIYNENLTHNSLLVEVGTEVNTVEEAVYSGKLFGKVLAQVLTELEG